MLGELKPIHRPGLVHIYHGVTWGPLVREIVSAATGKNIRDIVADGDPGPARLPLDELRRCREDVPLVAPSHVTGKPLPAPIAKAFKMAVGGTMPRSSRSRTRRCSSPASCRRPTCVDGRRDVAVRRDPVRGGELDGVRVMRPETLRAATKECRRLRPDIADGFAPCRWGTGYMLGNKRFGPYGRNAPAAFGNTGLTNIAVWADPERGLVRRAHQQRQAGRPPRGQALSRADWTGSPPRSPESADLLAVDPLDRHRHQHPAVGHHHRPVLVPVRVLACGAAVVLDQRLDLGAVRVGRPAR